MKAEKQAHKAAAKSGWIVLVLATGAAFVPHIGDIAPYFTFPMFFVCFVLSIVVMAQGGAADGVEMLLLTLVCVPIVIYAAPSVREQMIYGSPVAQPYQAEERLERYPTAPAQPTPFQSRSALDHRPRR